MGPPGFILPGISTHEWSTLQGSLRLKQRLFTEGSRLHLVGGQAIGILETLLTYTPFCTLQKRAAGLVVAGYLAFEVACKWEGWSRVYQPPELGVDSWRILRAKLGHVLFTRFIVGTLLSLFVAFLAFITFRQISEAR